MGKEVEAKQVNRGREIQKEGGVKEQKRVKVGKRSWQLFPKFSLAIEYKSFLLVSCKEDILSLPCFEASKYHLK